MLKPPSFVYSVEITDIRVFNISSLLSPKEINLGKIPKFIIKFIPLTFLSKIEKINQIYTLSLFLRHREEKVKKCVVLEVNFHTYKSVLSLNGPIRPELEKVLEKMLLTKCFPSVGRNI